jgi:hypothetical protein
MTMQPDAAMQFAEVELLDQRDLKMLLDRIISLQLAVLSLQQTVFEMRQREIERQFPDFAAKP